MVWLNIRLVFARRVCRVYEILSMGVILIIVVINFVSIIFVLITNKKQTKSKIIKISREKLNVS